MTRRSRRELERAVADITADVPDEPPFPGIPREYREAIPREYWGDRVAALRWLMNRIDDAEATQ